MRLEQVARVHRPFGLAGADDRVQFVDEQDDPALTGSDFLEERLEPVLEFSAVLGPRDHRPKVHRDEPFVFQRLRHVAAHDAPGQSLGDGRFAHARLADEHGIVLGPAREHLHDTADLLVPADHRIDLPLARQGR